MILLKRYANDLPLIIKVIPDSLCTYYLTCDFHEVSAKGNEVLKAVPLALKATYRPWALVVNRVRLGS